MFANRKIENIEQEVMEAVSLARKQQPLLNAMVSFMEVDEAISEAKNSNGKMAGLPIVLKDNVLTKGVRTTGSVQILDNYIGAYDATITKKLKDAGAVIIGKSALDGLGMGGTGTNCHTGFVHNPYDLNRMAGGSSVGSAVLVASGAVAFAIGSDTGDSVRKPASFVGIVGVKPTYGRISRYGIIPYASSLDHVGYFTRSVEDAALALEVLAGRDDKDMTSSTREVEDYLANLNGDLRGKKIGILKNVIDAIKKDQTLALFNELIEKCVNAGATVHMINMDQTRLQACLPVYYIIANSEATANHSNLDGVRFGMQEWGDSLEELMTNSRTKGFSFLLRKRFVIGSYSLADENQDLLLRKAQKVRRLLVEDYKTALSDIDVLIAPASGDVAPLLTDTSADQLSARYLIAENHMVLGNFSGYPSMTIPMGKIDGLPIGINITAKPFEEQVMFDIALGMENLTGCKNMTAEVNV
ncbi:MAG: Asp-tRNA(Asn)/Glu-tRNA(Gln) amidotransferase subunit GatA [Firmicutes bacterium HGW-Firmicutes-20]|nr:MAG: Asp-tRNA(Asn)/Glu-tRNA(Gln) amidotransferase subunit GatA [Firmicutes bacterium HGW-Firmicutes-20]PKM90161.1 MAG: Asp-tRNA(Asn)/Glu-tRNA(Gln) amidotransferase subunit GatA [Firmicutes bacterium HGW-Firmicutes-10]